MPQGPSYPYLPHLKCVTAFLRLLAAHALVALCKQAIGHVMQIIGLRDRMPCQIGSVHSANCKDPIASCTINGDEYPLTGCYRSLSIMACVVLLSLLDHGNATF